jgi:hypothetical protein
MNDLKAPLFKLQSLHLALKYEIGLSALAALLAVAYLVDVGGTLELALPAVGLLLAASVLLLVATRQWATLRQIDSSGPVLATERRLAELTVDRARSHRWLLLSTPLIWALLVTVLPHAFLGYHVYTAAGVQWIAINVAFGFATLAGAVWASGRLSPTSRVGMLLHHLGDHLTGRKVTEASAVLDAIAD